MKLLSKIWNELVGPDKFQEALIDSICAAIIADETVTEGEMSYVTGFIESLLRVDSKKAVAIVEKSLARVEGRELTELLGDISARLGTAKNREGVYKVVSASMCVDGEVSFEEEEMLQTMAEAFEIEAELASSLIEDAKREFIEELD